jgi:hypothetical protein
MTVTLVFVKGGNTVLKVTACSTTFHNYRVYEVAKTQPHSTSLHIPKKKETP